MQILRQGCAPGIRRQMLCRTVIGECPPDKNLALMHTKRMMPEFVCYAVNLEGLNFTIPEIQTLLNGITPGGHKVWDQQAALLFINLFYVERSVDNHFTASFIRIKDSGVNFF